MMAKFWSSTYNNALENIRNAVEEILEKRLGLDFFEDSNKKDDKNIRL